MSEIAQLKKRIIDSGTEGIETAIVRDDYEPAGDLMIRQLTESGEFITRRVTPSGGMGSDSKWCIFKAGFEPY